MTSAKTWNALVSDLAPSFTMLDAFRSKSARFPGKCCGRVKKYEHQVSCQRHTGCTHVVAQDYHSTRREHFAARRSPPSLLEQRRVEAHDFRGYLVEGVDIRFTDFAIDFVESC